jgi:UDP-N-acetylmuramate--alanine ligase
MDQPDTQTCQKNVATVQEYELTDAGRRLKLAGKRFHLIGAGGVGMSGLTKVLIKNKAIIVGSDQEENAAVNALRKIGADIKIGHNAQHLNSETEAVVISAAIKESNPELILARNRGCKVYKYAEMLGELMKGYEAIAVSGTHGKSTTGGWLVFCLKQLGVDLNFVIGADIGQVGGSAASGDSKFFVAEACEYDRSFLNISPKIACILNIEQDHLDYYKDENEIVEAFRQFVLGIRPTGILIANGEDQNVAKIIKDQPFAVKATDTEGDDYVRCETFGFDENCNFSAQNLRLDNGLYRFDIYHNGSLLGATRISLPGSHNVLNALAVVAIAVSAGFSPEQILEIIPHFNGVDRRLTLKGRFAQITVLDDYAHHPTEIRASLKACRQRYQPKRIWCVFQPHQYSRTRFLLKDFAESFKLADVTIVPEIYFVRDSKEAKKDVNSQILVDRIRENGTEAVFIDGFGAICDYLRKNVAPGEMVVTMGAGDVWKVADEYIQWLRENS